MKEARKVERTKLYQIYKCEVCGNIIVVIHDGVVSLVCCGKPMKLMEEQVEEKGGYEKHLPVVEETDRGINVKVGSVPHPMEEKHYIEWIELITADGRSHRKFLKPGDAPEADFDCMEKIKQVREYCNIHGLWKVVM